MTSGAYISAIKQVSSTYSISARSPSPGRHRLTGGRGDGRTRVGLPGRVAVGEWESVDEISDIWRVDHGSDREMVAEKADVMYAWWGEAVERSLDGAWDGR